MQLNYKQPDASVNVSKVSPMKRAVQIFAGLMVTVITIYVLLGLLINVAAPYVPKSLEEKLGKSILNEWAIEEDDETVVLYTSILEKIAGEEIASDYAIRIVEMDEVNAFAVPGDIIVFSSGFVESIVDEETIAFVIGHELGHFASRDHIKGYGRTMVLLAMANLIAGDDSSTSSIVVDILSKTETKFSQKDELNADAYGVQLVYNAYGNYDGGLAFFGELSKEYEQGQLASYFDSHPHPEKRIEAIKALEIKE